MKNLTLVFVAGLALAAFGCKKKDGVAAGGGDCATAVNHSMDLSKADMKAMGTDDKMMQKMVDLGIQHCKDDKWSADAIKCMVDAKAMGDAQACYGKLTPEQRDKMEKAAMELAPPPSDPGSAAAGSGDTGSAAAGSAAAGSAATGSAGSAAK